MTALRRYQALGRLKQGQMNRTESAYAQLLELKRQAGEIQWWKFDGLSLRLADKTFYKPDFIILDSQNQIQIHEVKGGYMTEDGHIKIKIAADMYPFVFKLVRLVRREWQIEEVGV